MTSRARLRDRFALGSLAPDIAQGVRAAISTLVPFYFARKLGHHELVWVALGGWLGTLADPGGARRERAKTLAIFAIAGALVVALADVAAVSTASSVAALAGVAVCGV